jgi:hypothetical protein
MLGGMHEEVMRASCDAAGGRRRIFLFFKAHADVAKAYVKRR